MLHPWLADPWLVVGFSGQAAFSARFLVQWLRSERAGRTIVPRSFWHLSLAGAVLLLAYAVQRRDAVFMVGQLFGLFVYGRNLALQSRTDGGEPLAAAPMRNGTESNEPGAIESEGAGRKAMARWGPVAVVLLCGVLMLLPRLGELGLTEPSEGRYAEIAREMLESGNWVTPRLNYVRHFEKPPLAYWMIALGEQLAGRNEWGVRLLPALFAIALVLLTYRIASRRGDRLAGVFAAAVLVTELLFFAVGRSATSDVFVTFWGAAAIACFLEWRAGDPAAKNPRRLYAVCLALGMLTKGPVVLVHGVLPPVVHLALRREWGALRRFGFGAATLVAALAFLPWMAAAEAETPGVWRHLVFEKATGAFVSGRGYHTEPWWYFLPVLLFGCMPWSFFALAEAANPRAQDGDDAADREAGFVWVWALSVAIFFSLSASKLMTYVLPVTLPIAVGNGRLWSRVWRDPGAAAGRAFRMARTAWAGVCVLVVLALAASAWLPPYAPLRAASGYVPWFAGLFLAYLAAWHGRGTGSRARWFPVMTAGLLAILFLFGLGARKAVELEYGCFERIARVIRDQARPDEMVVNYRCFTRSLPFYLERPVIMIDYDKLDHRFEAQTEDYRRNFRFGREALRDLLVRGRRVWIVTKDKYVESDAELSAATREVDRNGSLVLRVTR